jgi:hypothetical protein
MTIRVHRAQPRPMTHRQLAARRIGDRLDLLAHQAIQVGQVALVAVLVAVVGALALVLLAMAGEVWPR